MFSERKPRTILVELESRLYQLQQLRFEIDDAHNCAALNDNLSDTAATIKTQLEQDEKTQLSVIAETAQKLINTINKKHHEKVA